MNPFAIIIGFILLTGSLFYVAAPVRAGADPAKAKKSTGKASQSRQADHQAVILALRDLDFDYQAGKISEEDYPGIRAGLLEKAAHTLKDMEESSDARLEKLIEARRKQKGLQEKDSGPEKNPVNGFCANCQAPLTAEANFCMKCGTPVSHTLCPHCGKQIQPDDRFCPGCGKAIDQVE